MKKRDEFKIVSDFQKEIKGEISKPVKLGIALLLIFFVGFGGWSILAKIDKAAVAAGEIIPGGSNRVVQHLEGGVIEEILVKEGDMVKEGQILVRLSKSSAGANFQIYESALNTTIAEYSRLVAERDERDAVIYPTTWQQNPEKYKSLMDAQNQIFSERRKGYVGKVNILHERINQLDSQIKGIGAQLSAAQDQLEYANKDIAAVEKLLASGNTTMSRLLDLKTRKSEIEGRIGEYKSAVAKAQQEISENKLNIVNIKNETLNDVVEKIKEAQAKIDEYKQRGGNASDTLSRTEIRAPVAGIVKDMKFKTAGSAGVIPPNGEVLTIVPVADDMVAEVKINPNDISVLRKPDLKAHVRLLSYSRRHTPMLDGVLTYVSADSFKDPATQQNFYKGRVKIDTSLLKKYLQDNNEVNKDALLYPGMPVEVYIVTGERSPFSYMIDPIRNDLRKSFKEE